MMRTLPEITVGGRPIPLGRDLAVEVLLAADAGDRLRLSGPADPLAPWRAAPGETAVLRIDGRERFRGPVERTWAEPRREGLRTGLAARSSWLERAEGLPAEEEYRESTAAEVAARIADALGLEGRIEAPGPVRGLLIRRGDPVEFLRSLGGQEGWRVAVAGGRLHFGPALPPGRIHDLGPAARVTAFRATRRSRGISGRIAVDGDLPAVPLDRIRIGWPAGAALLGSPAPVVRAARVLLRIDGSSTATEISWVGEGDDPSLAALEDGAPAASAAGDGTEARA